MGQILHGCATTTEAVRRAIQNSQESLRGLAKRYGINQKTVAKWKQRETVTDRSTGPKEAKSTVLSIEEEAIIVAFRQHTLLPLDDCLYALQPTIPHLTRSSLHRCLQRHGISRLPEVGGGKPSKKKFKADRLLPHRHRRAPDRQRQALPLRRNRSHQQVRVRATGQEDRKDLGRGLPRSPYCGRPLQDPHGSHRQSDPVHLPTALCGRPDSKIRHAYVRHALPGERDRASAD
ncbi:hypothetical protein ABH973_000851 [Bradyrhizobium ottawaense]